MLRHYLLKSRLGLVIGFDDEDPYDDDGTQQDFLIDEDEYRI